MVRESEPELCDGPEILIGVASGTKRGVVVQLGIDPVLIEHGLSLGSVVCFNRFAGAERYVDGERFRTLELSELHLCS
jgi:hypothetical protein